MRVREHATTVVVADGKVAFTGPRGLAGVLWIHPDSVYTEGVVFVDTPKTSVLPVGALRTSRLSRAKASLG